MMGEIICEIGKVNGVSGTEQIELPLVLSYEVDIQRNFIQ
jgi:hypothetical protein